MIITRAAIMFSNGETVEGHNYGEINNMASKLGFVGDKVLGFTTSTGEFVLPTEAAYIAVESGQVNKILTTLTPDDIWPEYLVE